MPRRTGHLTLAAVGKLRERHWQIAQAEYIRRLETYTDFKLVEVKDMVGKSLPDAVGMVREGEGLLVAARGKRAILLSPDGCQLTSPELAHFVQTQFERYGDLAFLIGGPLGFDEAVYAAAHDRVALSSLTFPHELARIVLLEQLYRAFTIIHGEPYHK